MDEAQALAEAARILKRSGGFACMWNHRDLDDPSAGADRGDDFGRDPWTIPTGSDAKTRPLSSTPRDCSGAVGAIEERFIVQQLAAEYVGAWRSHGTLQRQAGAKFGRIVEMIEREVGADDTIAVPYYTRIWHSRRNENALG